MNVHTPLTVARMALIRTAPPAPERTARTLRSIIKRNPLLSLAMVRAACLSSVCVMCALSSGTPCVCACFDADSREHDSGRCCAHDGDLAGARPAHPSYRRGTDDESAADGRAPGGTPSSHAGRRSASGRQSCSRPAAGVLVQLKTAQFCSSPRQSRAGGLGTRGFASTPARPRLRGGCARAARAVAAVPDRVAGSGGLETQPACGACPRVEALARTEPPADVRGLALQVRPVYAREDVAAR